MLLLCCRYLANPAKLRSRVITSVNGRFGSRKKGRCNGCIGRKQENPYSNQKRGRTFRVIGKAQTLCFAGLYTVNIPQAAARLLKRRADR